MRRAFAVLTGAVLLAGCASEKDIGPAPADYKATMRTLIEHDFFDPYSLRDVKISDAEPGYLLFRSGWVVCLQLNAKNRMGGYVGLNTTAYLIRDDQVIDHLEGATLCNGMNLEPWPEMENRGSGAKGS